MIESKNIKSLLLESQNLKEEDARKFIVSAFANQYKYILLIKDINGKSWYSKDQISSYRDTQEEKKQFKEVENLFKKYERVQD